MSLSADGEREIFASTADRARFSPRASSSRRSAIVKADRLLAFEPRKGGIRQWVVTNDDPDKTKTVLRSEEPTIVGSASH
jgi:hypothetical protein